VFARTGLSVRFIRTLPVMLNIKPVEHVVTTEFERINLREGDVE
jgi:hypothetical protein